MLRITYDTVLFCPPTSPPRPGQNCLARGTTEQPHGTAPLGRLVRRHGEHGRAFSCSTASLLLLPTRTHTHRHARAEREREPLVRSIRAPSFASDLAQSSRQRTKPPPAGFLVRLSCRSALRAGHQGATTVVLCLVAQLLLLSALTRRRGRSFL